MVMLPLSTKLEKRASKLSIAVDRDSAQGLVHQISQAITEAVAKGTMNVGDRLPSVRDLAKQIGVSAFTVSAAYDILAARGTVAPRRGKGYFIAPRSRSPSLPERDVARALHISESWLSTDVFAYGRLLASPGCGWLPPDWYAERALIGDAFRRLARSKPEQLINYGHPAGYKRLRQHIATELKKRAMMVSEDQVILTHGATHALDLVVRTCLRPGDAVMVEDPGYANLNGLISQHGCKLLPVPRWPDGLDLDSAARIAERHRPKAMFVTTVLHNPLGTTLTPADAYRLLALADRFDFVVVEDDICRRFGSDLDPCLASMDGLSRVISVNGYSKTIAPSLRVGYLACNKDLAARILQMKMATGLTTSEISERIVLEVLSDPNHRRVLNKISNRLTAAREAYKDVLEAAGLTLLANPDGGMFLSAGWPVSPTGGLTARRIAEDALKENLVLAPGDLFHVATPQSIWFRFNVAHRDIEPLLHFLRSVPRRYCWS